jgi:AcrR family transcriptional regulator
MAAMSDQDDAATAPRDGRREVVLAAAIAEFAEKGFAGGRITSIAKRSRSNAQLIYYYFDSKEGLYRAALERMMRRSHEHMSAQPPAEGIADAVAQHATRARGEDGRLWQRFWIWEAIEGGEGEVLEEDARRAVWATTVEEVRRAQQAGEIDPELDPEMVALVLQSILILPHILPQLARWITGDAPSDEAFARRQDAFLAELLRRLGPGV